MEYGQAAAATPAAIPIAVAMAELTTASSTVLGSRPSNSRVTGSDVRADTPRLPRASRRRKLPYCTGSGRSSSSWLRRRPTSSSLASTPAMTRAGSPGSTRTIKNTMTETPSSVTTAPASRSARYRRSVVIDRPHRNPGAAGGRRCSAPRLLPSRTRVDRGKLLVRERPHVRHLRRIDDRETLYPEKDPWRVLPHLLRRLAVEAPPPVGAELLLGGEDQPVHLRVRVEARREAARRGVRREELEGLLGGVEEGGRPAQKVKLGGVPLGRGRDGRDVRRPVHRLQFDHEPDLAEVAGDRLRGLLVLNVASGGMEELEPRPRLDPRLREERLRPRRVVCVGPRSAGPEQRRGHRGVHGVGGAEEDVLHDRRLVHRVVERLPHAPVGEERLPGVDRDEDRPVARREQDLERRVPLERGHVGEWRQDDQIHLPRQEEAVARRRLGNAASA